MEAELDAILKARSISEEDYQKFANLNSLASLLTASVDKPSLTRFSKDLTLHNCASLTGRRGPGAIPTLADFWTGAEVNGKGIKLKICLQLITDKSC